MNRPTYVDEIIESIHNTDKNVAVLDGRVEALEETTRITATDVTEVKLHLSRQNGAIPHIQEDIATIYTRLNSHDIKLSEIQVSQKLLLTLIGGITIGLLIALARFFLKA